MRVIHTDKEYYWVNFGMKGIILLNQNSKEIERGNDEFLLYCGLISHQPFISLQEVRMILSLINLNDYPDFFNWLHQEAKSSSMSQLEIDELYQQAIGEMGLSLNDFYTMTPKEIETSYQGFINCKELEVNLIKTAVVESLQGNLDTIYLTEPRGYEVGNLEERKTVFTKLGIEEVEQ